jgi:hypothetical protein
MLATITYSYTVKGNEESVSTKVGSLLGLGSPLFRLKDQDGNVIKLPKTGVTASVSGENGDYQLNNIKQENLFYEENDSGAKNLLMVGCSVLLSDSLKWEFSTTGGIRHRFSLSVDQKKARTSDVKSDTGGPGLPQPAPGSMGTGPETWRPRFSGGFSTLSSGNMGPSLEVVKRRRAAAEAEAAAAAAAYAGRNSIKQEGDGGDGGCPGDFGAEERAEEEDGGGDELESGTLDWESPSQEVDTKIDDDGCGETCPFEMEEKEHIPTKREKEAQRLNEKLAAEAARTEELNRLREAEEENKLKRLREAEDENKQLRAALAAASAAATAAAAATEAAAALAAAQSASAAAAAAATAAALNVANPVVGVLQITKTVGEKLVEGAEYEIRRGIPFSIGRDPKRGNKVLTPLSNKYSGVALSIKMADDGKFLLESSSGNGFLHGDVHHSCLKTPANGTATVGFDEEITIPAGISNPRDKGEQYSLVHNITFIIRKPN